MKKFFSLIVMTLASMAMMAGKAGAEGIDEAQTEGASYKFFREGQLIIVKNNKAYNVYGMAL